MRLGSVFACLLLLLITSTDTDAYALPDHPGEAQNRASGIFLQNTDVLTACARVGLCSVGEKTTSVRRSTSGQLFTGEQFDPNLNFYYLRARYYNQANGRFVGMDSWQGTSSDPRTLHKYAYAHGDPINGIDPSGHITLGQLAVATGVVAVLTNTAITGYTFGRAAQDSDGLPDGVTISLRAGAARGLGGALGADLVYDFKTGDLWGFGAGDISIAPLTVFRPQARVGASVTAGFIWNMSSPKDFNGFGATATWPLGTAALLARARNVSTQQRGGFWGFMTQTAKLAKNRQNWSLQFGFSGFVDQGPAFVRLGPGTAFSSDVFGLSLGRKLVGTRTPLVDTIERVMRSLKGQNSPESLVTAISAIERL